MNERMLAVLEAVAKDNDLLVDYVQRTAGDIEPLPPGPTLKTIGRGAHIVGDLLDGVAKAQAMQAVAAPFVWVSRVGSLLSGMVEAATPRSFAHLLSRHWLALLLIFEAFAVAGGIVLTAPTVVQFGLTALLLTALAGVGVWSVSRYIMGTKRWWLVPLLLVAIALAGLMALGVVELAHLGKAHSWIPIFGRVPARLAG